MDNPGRQCPETHEPCGQHGGSAAGSPSRSEMLVRHRKHKPVNQSRQGHTGARDEQDQSSSGRQREQSDLKNLRCPSHSNRFGRETENLVSYLSLTNNRSHASEKQSTGYVTDTSILAGWRDPHGFSIGSFGSHSSTQWGTFSHKEEMSTALSSYSS